jgi:hypothetical protein
VPIETPLIKNSTCFEAAVKTAAICVHVPVEIDCALKKSFEVAPFLTITSATPNPTAGL